MCICIYFKTVLIGVSSHVLLPNPVGNINPNFEMHFWIGFDKTY